MAKRKNQDSAKAKAAKQKKIAIGGGVLLVLLLAIQVPKMMKMMNPQPKPPIVNGVPVSSTSTAPGATPSSSPATPAAPADPNSLAAPTLGGTPTATPAPATELVSAVPVSADPGQLESFNRFASKDPFATQVTEAAAGAQGGGGTTVGGGASGTKPGSDGTVPPTAITVPPSGPSTGGTSTPPVAAPTTAVISLNGELLSVPTGTDFPVSGAVFDRLGAPLFRLVSVSAKSAKIAIVGGKYADGSAAITLTLKKPLTLQNTADGTKYTLILQPPDTPTTAAGAATTPATTTPSAPVVPPSGSGG